MNSLRNKLLHQIVSFIIFSGIGFLIDFGIYYYLTSNLVLPVMYANMVSAIPAITWVFVLSTRKVFLRSKNSRIPIWVKYVSYLVYQFILLSIVSYIAQFLYDMLYIYTYSIPLVHQYFQLICKCMITPITMICNFLVMKNIIERL